MAIVQCINGHYYDDSKNSECPYCRKMEEVGSTNELGEQLTSYFDSDTDDGQLTEAYGDNIGEDDRTIGIFLDETQNELTVGWLVCMNGPVKGKSYVIHSGQNFGGRSVDMDFVLTDDEKISREKHFSVVYDPKSITFYFVSGNGQSYINGEAINKEYELSDGDVIKVGDTEYIFIPFCKKGRVWE